MSWPPLEDDLVRDAVLRVLRSGTLVGGSEVVALEHEFASALGLERVVAVSSGTAAVTAALLACGVARGDSVVVPALTFSGSVLPVLHIGADPVFLDVEPDTYCLDPSRSLELAIRSNARAVILVHLHGYPVAISHALRTDFKRANVRIIEDACQAPGALLPEGLGVIGSQGDASAFSLNERKQVFGGEGGLVATKDANIEARLRRLRRYGELPDQPGSQWRSYTSLETGYNWKLPELAAAIARVSLRQLEQRTLLANRNARTLTEALSSTEFVAPTEPAGRHAWHKYRVRCTKRDRFIELLRGLGVPASLWQTQILPEMPAFVRWSGVAGEDYPVAREVISNTIVVGDEVNPLFGTSDEEVHRWATLLRGSCS